MKNVHIVYDVLKEKKGIRNYKRILFQRNIEPTYLLMFILVIMCFIIFNASAVWAQQCRPENNCANCPEKSERLKCKFDTMADEGKKTMQMLQETPGILTPAQHHGMAKAKERLDKEKNRLKPDDFKIMAKKKSVNCQLVEAAGNGDGVCEPKAGEDCVEVLDDGIGNDDGICWPLNGKKREVCAQICDEEAVLLDESAIDEDAAAELEGMYDTMTGHIKEVNETVPETLSLIQALASMSDDPCVLQTSLERNPFETYKKAKWAAMGARAATDVAERFCDQTYGFWFSFTIGAACIGAETAVTALNTWWDIVDSVEAQLDAMTLDATLACAQQAAEASDNTGELITDVQEMLIEVKSKHEEILSLMKTPPGKRVGYPKP